MRLDPAQKDPIKAADWLEASSVYSEEGRSSLESLRSYIQTDGTLPDEDREVPDDEVAENLTNDAVREIARRAHVLGPAYPFKLSGGEIRAPEDVVGCLPYLFCLITADRDLYQNGDSVTPRLFEHLSRAALLHYLGGTAIRFGFPRDTMPTGIRDATQELAKQTGSRLLQQGYPVNATDKDLGLDVVGWKPFPDGFPGHLQVYMQCATGDDWTEKTQDPPIATWRKILYYHLLPVRALAIPYILGDEREWDRIVTDFLLMDRIRISWSLGGTILDEPPHDWLKHYQEAIQRARALGL